MCVPKLEQLSCIESARRWCREADHLRTLAVQTPLGRRRTPDPLAGSRGSRPASQSLAGGCQQRLLLRQQLIPFDVVRPSL